MKRVEREKSARMNKVSKVSKATMGSCSTTHSLLFLIAKFKFEKVLCVEVIGQIFGLHKVVLP
jgi:hypothetical protein